MKICHVCAAECSDEAELCPICGAELIDAAEDNGVAEQDEVIINNPVLAASVEDVVTAEIFRDLLRENEIPFSCDEADPEAAMKLTFGGGFVAEDIYVDESDLAKAEELYEQVLNAEPEFDEADLEEAFDDNGEE